MQVRKVSRLSWAPGLFGGWDAAVGLLERVLSYVLATLAVDEARTVCLFLAVLGSQVHVGKRFFFVADGLGSNGGFEISITTLGLIGLYAGWLVDAAFRPRAQPSGAESVLGLVLPAAVFASVVLLSVLVANSLKYAASGAWDVTQMFLVFVFAAIKLRERDLRLVTLCVTGVLLVESALMLGQAWGMVGTFNLAGFQGTEAEFAGKMRPSGTFGSPNNAAGFVAAAATLCLCTALSAGPKIDRMLAGFSVVCSMPPLAYTLSRGGWLGMVSGFVLVMYFFRKKIPWLLLVTIAVCLILVCAPFFPAIVDRAIENDGSAQVRMRLNRLAIAMIFDHPLLGVGINNFVSAIDPYRARGYSLEWTYTVHNLYLQVASETGLIGLCSFLWFMFVTVREGFAIGLRLHNRFGVLATSCSIVAVTYLIQSLLEPSIVDAPAHFVWLVLAMIPALRRFSTRIATS